MNAFVALMNSWSVEWWRWFGHAGWQSAVVVGLLVIMVSVGRRWPAPLRYALLVVALLKFASPPMLSMPYGLFSRATPTVVARWTEMAPVSVAITEPIEEGTISPEPANLAGNVQDNQPSSDSGTLALSFSWTAWLMVGHWIGSLAVAGWLGVQWRRLRKIKRTALPVKDQAVHEQFDLVARGLGLRRIPDLLICERLAAPIVFGLFKPAVVLPPIVAERLPRSGLRTVLAHELAHCHRRDLWVNALELVLLVFWWFHPLLWILHRVIRNVREDCCDDLLLARELTSRDAYCDVLVRVARELALKTPNAGALGFGDHLHPLARRLERIMDDRLTRRVKLSVGGVVLIAVTSGLLLPGLHSQPAESNQAPPPVSSLSPPAENPAAKLQREREAADAERKRFDEEDRELMLRRGPLMPRRQAEVVITPEIRAMSVAELFRELGPAGLRSKRQTMLLAEFLNRKQEAFQFLTRTFTGTAQHPSPTSLDRRKAMDLFKSHSLKLGITLDNTVAVLGAALQDVDPAVAESAAQGLIALGPQARPAIPALMDSLKRGNGQAAAALSRVAPESDDVIQGMLQLLRDRSQKVEVKSSILQAIAQSNLKAHRTLIEPVLLAEYAHADRRLKRKIAYTLLRCGSKSDEAAAMISQSIRDVPKVLVSGEYSDLTVAELIEMVREPRVYFEDVEAAQALQRFGRDPSGPDAIPALVEMLRDRKRGIRGVACSALANMGPAAKPAAAALLDFVKDKSGDGRDSAIFALHAIYLPANDPAPVPTFLAALEDEDDRVRRSAARALGRYGDLARPAVPKLVKLLLAENAAEQLDVAAALWRIDPSQSHHSIPALIRMIEAGESPNEASNAARLLGEMGASAVEAIPALKRVIRDEQRDLRTREEVKKALPKIDENISL